MSITSIQIQIKKETLKKHLRIKKISQETYDREIESLQQSVQNNAIELDSKNNVTVSFNNQERKVTSSVHENSDAITPEMQTILEKLNRELLEIDHEKAALSNSLQNIPPHINAKDVVDQILYKREEWIQKRNEIWHVKDNGCLPSEDNEPDAEFQQDEFMKSLPDDKFELDRQIRNLRSNLSKWPKRAERVKTEAKKAELIQRIAHGQLQLEAMVQKFNGI